MPPKQKITKDMIIDAAFQIVRKEGIDKLTARCIAEYLHCSTQPVLYYFATVEDIKRAVYNKADAYHTNYIMSTENGYGNPMLAIGMNYIKFAVAERKLFCFLFQSDMFSGTSLSDLINAEEVQPLLLLLQQQLNIALDAVKEIFGTIFVFVHGYAGLFANNRMLYDEEQIKTALTKVFNGAVAAAKGEYYD